MELAIRRLLGYVRYAVRSLRRAPLFTTAAVLSIAFGIGANTAVFTLVDQVLLRRLPVVRPAELVQVAAPNTESFGGGTGDGTELSYAMYRDLRDHNRVFDGMFCRMPQDLHVGYRGTTEAVVGELVSGSFFPVLGVKPAAGRLFTAAEDRSVGDHPVAVLAYSYWRSRFAGDRGVIGQTVHVNGYPFQIVGVAQAGFEGIDVGQPARMYVPVIMQPKLGPAWLDLATRRFRWVQVFGRLRDGITLERADAGLQPLYHSLLEQEARDAAFTGASPETRRRFLAGRLTVTSADRGHSGLRDYVREPLLILTAVAGLVLLIVCANVANLLIARGAARQRELALRLAVGAGRRDVVALFVVESLLLAAAGALAGLVFATWGAASLLHFYQNPVVSPAIDAAPDLRILGFTMLLALVTAMGAGVIPAVRSTGLDIAPTLKTSGGTVAGEHARIRKLLVVAQVALAFLLLIGAGVFVRSLRNLLHVDPGFRTERVLSFTFDLSRGGYDAARARTFARSFAERVSRMAGVSSAAYTFMPLLEGGGWGMGLTVEGYEPKPGESAGSICNAVSPGFFKTLGIPLVAGREFTDKDDERTAMTNGWPYSVAVVNETFAKRYFKGANPIGRHIGIDDKPGTVAAIEIVGLVKDTHAWAIREDPQPQVFVPYLQATMEGVNFYVRTAEDPMALMPRIRREMSLLDGQLAIFNVSTLAAHVDQSVTNERLIATLSTTLSVMATLLSLVGLYGVMAFMVTRRRREIGIRMALGALASQIARGVLREAGVLVAVGLAIGLVSAWALGRYVQSQLYGVAAVDALTIALAGITFGVVAAVAALVPARRAARVAPMAALRDE